MIFLERTWYVQFPGRQKEPFVMRVGPPIADGAEATCRVDVGNDSMNVRGVDAWQAVALALRYARRTVESLEGEGAVFTSGTGLPMRSDAIY